MIPRAVVVITAFWAALAGSYGAYSAIRAVGPADRTNDYGYGAAALAPPGGGTLLQTRNFTAVLAALRRELGAGARLESLDVKWTDAHAVAVLDGRRHFVDIDASGRSQSRAGDDAGPGARVPLGKLDAAAIDRLVAAARKQNSAPVEELNLEGNTRQWRIDMVRGEPDAFVANLDGSGVRLDGEPNPEPVGAGPDSMLRRANLAKALAAAANEGDKLLELDVRPDRVTVRLDQGTRELELDYGYDAQLTSRDIRAKTGAPQPAISLAKIDPGAPERIARSRVVKGLGHVQYVLLSDGGLSLYQEQGRDPTYVTADLHGRHVTWPGR